MYVAKIVFTAESEKEIRISPRYNLSDEEILAAANFAYV